MVEEAAVVERAAVVEGAKVCGIAGYAAYVPGIRVSRESFAQAGIRLVSRGVMSVAVPDSDEDTMTMMIEAGRRCLGRRGGGFPPGGGKYPPVGYLATASSAYPYDVRFHPAMAVEALGIDPAAETAQFAGSPKAGTEALLGAFRWSAAVSAGAKAGDGAGLMSLALVGDYPAVDAGLDEDHGSGAAAVAFLITGNPQAVIARLEGTSCCSAETLGNWFRPRRSAAVKDIGVPGYSEDIFSRVVLRSVKNLLAKLDRTPADYRSVVFPQPDASLPLHLARACGFTEQQLTPGLVAREIGDAGAASSLLGLAAVLDRAAPGDRVLVASFGAGSGADAISLEIMQSVEASRQPVTVEASIAAGRQIQYMQYRKFAR